MARWPNFHQRHRAHVKIACQRFFISHSVERTFNATFLLCASHPRIGDQLGKSFSSHTNSIKLYSLCCLNLNQSFSSLSRLFGFVRKLHNRNWLPSLETKYFPVVRILSGFILAASIMVVTMETFLVRFCFFFLAPYQYSNPFLSLFPAHYSFSAHIRDGKCLHHVTTE